MQSWLEAGTPTDDACVRLCTVAIADIVKPGIREQTITSVFALTQSYPNLSDIFLTMAAQKGGLMARMVAYQLLNGIIGVREPAAIVSRREDWIDTWWSQATGKDQIALFASLAKKADQPRVIAFCVKAMESPDDTILDTAARIIERKLSGSIIDPATIAQMGERMPRWLTSPRHQEHARKMMEYTAVIDGLGMSAAPVALIMLENLMRVARDQGVNVDAMAMRVSLAARKAVSLDPDGFNQFLERLRQSSIEQATLRTLLLHLMSDTGAHAATQGNDDTALGYDLGAHLTPAQKKRFVACYRRTYQAQPYSPIAPYMPPGY